MKKQEFNLTPKNIFSLYYHSLFEYPLSLVELIKWEPGKKFKENMEMKKKYIYKKGFFLLQGSKAQVLTRTLRKRYSVKKMILARKAAAFLKNIPTVLMVGVTGSLAMFNAPKESDIDLLIICRKETLWTTRLICLVFLKLFGFKVRRFAEKKEEDKLCLNMWLDERHLTWPKKDRNFYTAHEIVQIVPLINKEGTYQQFLLKNAWIKDYWLNAVKIKKTKRKTSKKAHTLAIFEPIAMKFQWWYMKEKRTREVVKKTKAIFHPIDVGKEILSKLPS